jgi:hypothetical protein
MLEINPLMMKLCRNNAIYLIEGFDGTIIYFESQTLLKESININKLGIEAS